MEIESYDAMTVQLCVETCRALAQRYAYVQKDSCACVDSLTGNKNRGACMTACSGQFNQLCGGGGALMSVYDTG